MSGEDPAFAQRWSSVLRTGTLSPPGADGLLPRLQAFAELLAKAPAGCTGPALVCRDHSGLVTMHPLGTRFTFGRDPGCTWSQPAYREISRVHFEIIQEESEYVLRDAGSRNGTRLYGDTQPITQRVLLAGDVIQAGGCLFGFLRQ